VFSTPSENKDIIVTTDRKDTDSYADALTRIPEDATVPDEISTAPIRHVCVKCGEGYYSLLETQNRGWEPHGSKLGRSQSHG